MAKQPEKHEHEPHKPKREKLPQMEKLLASGWKRADILAGASESAPFPLDETQTAHVSHFFDEHGGRLKGHERPHAKVVEDQATSTAKVVVSEPVSTTVIALYKIEDDHNDEDDGLDEELELA